MKNLFAMAVVLPVFLTPSANKKIAMKQKFKIVLLLIFLAAGFSQANAQNEVINSQLNQHKTTKMSTETLEKNKKTITHLYNDLLNSRKLDELNTVVSEDYFGIRGERGVSGFQEAVGSVIAGFPDIKWKIEDLLADNDKVVVRWSWTGTHTQPFRGIPASNKVVNDNAIVIYQFDNEGKIVHAWLQGDRLGFLIQIGAIPANIVPQPPAGK